MTKEQEEKIKEFLDGDTARDFLIDAYGFFQWLIDHEKLAESVVAETIVHDICGLVRGEDCFSPRVSGYRKHINEREIFGRDKAVATSQ